MNTMSASFEVRDLKAGWPESYPVQEYDVVAKCSDGIVRHSDQTFPTRLHASAFIVTCLVEVATGTCDLSQWTVVPNPKEQA